MLSHREQKFESPTFKLKGTKIIKLKDNGTELLFWKCLLMHGITMGFNNEVEAYVSILNYTTISSILNVVNYVNIVAA